MVDSVAYIDRPAWARWLQRILLISGYLLMGVAGYASVTQLNFPAREAGYVMMAASALAIVGVVTRFYNLELVALWPLVTSIAVVVIWLVIPPQSAILTGWLVAAYIPTLAARLLALNLLANKARRRAEA